MEENGWVGRTALFMAGLGIAVMATTVERLMTPVPGLELRAGPITKTFTQ